MKKTFSMPDITVSNFATENLLAASGTGNNVKGVASTSEAYSSASDGAKTSLSWTNLFS